MAQEYGLPLSQIPEKQFCIVEQENAVAVRKGLEASNIIYHATVREDKMMLAYAKSDSKKVSGILEKCRKLSKDSDFLERTGRFYTDNSPESARALLPEIAEVMHVSTTSLERKPPDLQVWLAMTFTANCYADDLTLKEALQREMSLTTETEKEIQQLTEEKKPTLPEQSNPDTTQELKRQEHEDQQKKKEKQKGVVYTSREVFKRNAQRLHNQSNSSEQKEITEEHEERVKG